MDTSGSMSGTKIEQLKNAMYTIVDQLQENDLFNLVEFSTYSYLWNLDTEDVQTVSLSNYGHFADNLDVTFLITIFLLFIKLYYRI